MALSLGRAEEQKTADLPNVDTLASSQTSTSKDPSDNELSQDHSPSPSLKQKFSAKIKSVIHRNEAFDQPPHERSAQEGVKILAPIPEPPAECLRLDDKKPPDSSEKFKAFIKNPIDTVSAAVKSSSGMAVTDELVTAEISHAKDVELVQAYEHLLEKGDNSQAKQSAEEKVEELTRSRQDLYIRWALDRHVAKIRVLDVANAVSDTHPKPSPAGSSESKDWVTECEHFLQDRAKRYGRRYVGVYSDPDPPNKNTLTSAGERIIIASAPFQSGYVKLRRIYRWEDPVETLFALAGFLLLWFFNLLLPAVLGYIIFTVVRRRYQQNSVEDLRNEVRRIEDEDEDALNLMEFIEKHGTEDWVNKLIEGQGKRMLLEMADLASMMEIMISFYEWRNPRRTIFALCVLSSVTAFLAIAPLGLVLKAMALGTGLSIFFLWPIQSKYPEYRYLASPLRWLFWEIPDHPEWALSRLKIDSIKGKNALLASNGNINQDNAFGHTSTDSPLPTPPPSPETKDSQILPHPTALISYPAAYETHQGQLIITATDIHFKSLVRRKELWRIPFERLRRVEKVSHSTRMRSGQDLRFMDADGQSYTADDLSKRDEAFVQIAGYSGADWQVIG